MNDLINFLTSKEIIVVYIVATLACILCFVIHPPTNNISVDLINFSFILKIYEKKLVIF